MFITFHCHHCGRKLRTPEQNAGRPWKCDNCANLITVPDFHELPSVSRFIQGGDEEVPALPPQESLMAKPAMGTDWQRLDYLEKQHTSLRASLWAWRIAGILMFTVLAANQFRPVFGPGEVSAEFVPTQMSSVVEAEEFVIKGSDGVVRATLGAVYPATSQGPRSEEDHPIGVALRFLDSDGVTERAKLVIEDENSTERFSLRSKKSGSGISLGTTITDSSMDLVNSEGNTTARLTAHADGGSNLTLQAKKLRQRLNVGVSRHGDNPAFFDITSPEGATFSLTDPNGVPFPEGPRRKK